MSGGRPRVPAYVAVSRSFFDHYLWKKDAREPYHWSQAFHWLFTHAAWRPQGQRMARGVAAVKRGQIAVTIRGLSKQFKWPRGKVEYFLQRLIEDGMVSREIQKTKIQTSSGPRSSYRATVLTVCNYEKFQQISASAAASISQRVGQRSSGIYPQLPGFTQEKPSEQPNHFTIDKSKAEQGAHLYKPHHLATSKDRRWIWADYPSDDWRLYNADYREVREADILPEKRIGGRGNWFYKAGEAQRPKRRRA